MCLSTSISDCKRGVALLIAVAACTYLLSFVYVLFISPVSLEQKVVRQTKRAYAAELDRTGESKVVFVGGSSTLMGVMPSAMREESGISAVNAGLTAAEGSGFMILWGLFLCEPGDTLVLMIEPDLLAVPYDQPMPHSLGEIGLPLKYWALKKDFVNGSLWRARPRLTHIKTSGIGLTSILGTLVREHRYPNNWEKYATKDGFLALPLKAAPPLPETLNKVHAMKLDLSDQGASALAWVSAYCRKNEIRVCYAFPKVLVAPDAVDACNARAERLAESISRYIPVLEPVVYATSDRQLFYDSVRHLNVEAARSFSVDLSRRLVKAGLAAPASDRLQEKGGGF
jgi:hypothetical protein